MQRHSIRPPSRFACVATVFVTICTAVVSPVSAFAPRRVQDPERRVVQPPPPPPPITELAEDVQPTVTKAERDIAKAALELIVADKPDQALAVIESARGPEASATLDFIAGNIHFSQSGQLDQAIRAYSSAVEKSPRFRSAWQNLGQARLRSKDHTGAREALARTIDLGKGDATTYGLLGVATQECGDMHAAESAFWLAHELDPDEADWRLALIEIMIREKRYAHAITMVDAKAVHGRRGPELLQRKVQALLALDRPREAAEASMQAVESSPDSPVAPVLRTARVLLANRETEPVLTILTRLDALPDARLSDEQRKTVLRLRAQCAAADGDADTERECLERAVRLDPTDGDALLALGRSHERAGETEKAKHCFRRAAEIPANRADALTRTAQLLIKEQNYVGAVPLLEESLQLEPRNAVRDYLERVKRIAFPLEQPELRSSAVTLAVTAEGAFIYGGRKIDLSGIRPILERLQSQRPDEDLRVVLVADAGETPSSVLVRAIDECKLAGVERVSLATQDQQLPPELPASLRELDARPKAVYQPAPNMAAELRAKAPATVHVLLIVDENGHVATATVQKSSDPAFEPAALEATERWRFEPGTREGKPVPFRVRVPITFPGR